MTVLSQGTEFAGYRIEGVVGQGGMGVVYRATHIRLNRPVALKVIAPELAGDGGRSARRFERESQLAASIDHPNVIPSTRRARRTAGCSSRCASSRGPTSER